MTHIHVQLQAVHRITGVFYLGFRDDLHYVLVVRPRLFLAANLTADTSTQCQLDEAVARFAENEWTMQEKRTE